MFKIRILVGLIVTLFAITSASAQSSNELNQRGGYAGMCNIGTCAEDGGRRAKDVRTCSAANCKKPPSSKGTKKK